MTIFIASVVLVLCVSALCSISEAALYAVRRPFIRQLSNEGVPAGDVLLRFKDNMERPIAAILIVNTIANTAGAAIAGAQARVLFGEPALIWFSLAFTLAVLFFSEIIPKVIGVAYNQLVARVIALPWAVGIKLLYPVIYLIDHLSQYLKPGRAFAAPEDEVQQLAMISAEEGSIMPYEADLVRNVLHLDRVTTRDIMTPRPVVVKLPSDMTIGEISKKTKNFTVSRIPVYDSEDPETWKGVVFTRDLLSAMAQDRFDAPIESLCVPIRFVSEKTPGHILLRLFLRHRTHLFGVNDEYGDITGVVTLEDVVESLLGEEIVDEVDIAMDMQEVAKRRNRQRLEGQQDDTAK